MPKNNTEKKVEQDVVPTPVQTTVVSAEQNIEPTKYVVVRSGLRVSDTEYLTSNNPSALAERDFWQRIINKYPDGTKMAIVEYNKKLHRNW